MDSYTNLVSKVNQYKRILDSTTAYRKEWHENLRSMIEEELKSIIEHTGLPAQLELKKDIANMEAIIFSLGRVSSGMSENINHSLCMPIVKFAGSLIYQQLFNGKIMITISYPFLEGFSKPKPPKMVEILRPEELTKPFISRHVEEFMKEIISWEDYDDDAPAAKIGFQTGFQLQANGEN